MGTQWELIMILNTYSSTVAEDSETGVVWIQVSKLEFEVFVVLLSSSSCWMNRKQMEWWTSLDHIYSIDVYVKMVLSFSHLKYYRKHVHRLER